MWLDLGVEPETFRYRADSALTTELSLAVTRAVTDFFGTLKFLGFPVHFHKRLVQI